MDQTNFWEGIWWEIEGSVIEGWLSFFYKQQYENTIGLIERKRYSISAFILKIVDGIKNAIYNCTTATF